MIKITNSLVAVLMLACTNISYADSDVDAVRTNLSLVNERIISGLTTLQENNNLNEKETLLLIRKEASPIMDFNLLTKKALGKHWRKADDTIREEFTEVFKILLENTYAKVFSKYKNQSMKIISSKKLSNGNISALVKVRGLGSNVEIEYIFTKNESGEYLMGNIKVEGISLIATYRRQFSNFIRNNGIEGLLARLKKNADSR